VVLEQGLRSTQMRRPAMFIYIYIHIHIHSPLIPSSYGAEVFIFLWIYYTQSVGLLGRVIGLSQGLYLNTGQQKQNNAHTHQTSMP
jgi:hypothetical protein